MFSKEDNERLTRVGPGTPMGKAMRRFWIPFLMPEELSERDGTPLRVRLLGEDLIAFRDTEGRLGLLERYCPHRRVDLYFGRNEQCGLRCVYHGWKFDIKGNIVDMPAEPANSTLKDELKITAYPIVEWGGLIWAYMGEPECMPEVPPEIEWGVVPPAHRHITKRLQETNFAQGVEGGIDSSHVGILHSVLNEDTQMPFRQRQISPNLAIPYLASDTAPRFFVRHTDYGMAIGARRNATDEEYYWRITQFLAPFYTMIAPNKAGGPIMGHAWVPIDDHNCWLFTMTWNAQRPLEAHELDHGGVHAQVVPDGSYRPLINRTNDYRIDREAQRLRSSTGIDSIGMQDTAIQESMGTIVDRSRENLGSGDAAIVGFRKSLLRMADGLEAGQGPMSPLHPEWYRVRSVAIVLPKGVDFIEGATDQLKAISPEDMQSEVRHG